MDSNETLINSTIGDDELIRFDVFYWEKILLSVIAGLVAIIGIVGNTMTILAVAFSRTLQTPTNAFVTSLSVADLMTFFFLIWSLVGSFGEHDWPLPQVEWHCELTGLMIYACIGTSLYNLGTLALNNLILITNPFLYKKIFTSWKLVVLVSIPWILPAGMVMTLRAAGTGVVGFDRLDSACRSKDSHKKEQMFTYCTTVGFTIPTIVIFVCYVWIYIYMKQHFRIKQDIFDLENAHQRNKTSQQEIKVTKNLFIVVCAFFASFIPCFLVYPVPLSSVGGRRLKLYFRLPIYANSAINFFIYAWKHPHFKVVFGHSIRGSYDEIPEPSKLLTFLLSKRCCWLCCFNIVTIWTRCFSRKPNCFCFETDENERNEQSYNTKPCDGKSRYEHNSAIELNVVDTTGDGDNCNERTSILSPEARSIDIYKRTGWSRYIQIQLLEGTFPTRKCQDTQAVVVFRDDGIMNSSLEVLELAGEEVEVEYQSVKAEGGKYVSKGVILTKAGKNPGYIIHVTVVNSLARRRDVVITALRVAEKHELKSVALPSYLLAKMSINELLELIEEFIKVYRPICVNFVQLFLTKRDFVMCQEMRHEGDLKSFSH